MPYQKTIWKNREVEKPRTYTMQDNGDGTYTLNPAEGTVIEAGTPIIAQTMQNIEDGIEEAYNQIDEINTNLSEYTLLSKSVVSADAKGAITNTQYRLYYNSANKALTLFDNNGTRLGYTILHE